MHNSVRKLQPAQKEVKQFAHNQDLVETPRRAWLDRVAEGRQFEKFEQQDAEPTDQDK